MFIGQSRTRNQQVVDSLRTRVGGLRMGAGLGSAAEGLWRGSRHGLGFSPLRSELQLHSKQKLRRTRNYSFRPGDVLELALRAWRRRNAGTSSLNLGSVGLIGTEQWPYNHLWQF
ncbi:uncharacterized protein [Physcomitrium patens]|uniref:uncharacterized protein isoform X21 n=1 Tax=Physcomitrium patens TaxID=3218 RepID=UPI000D166806|nr:uncharacterized protein LOC112296156 isoform X15 [Physcomitrium patens]|eukprot:XP_024404209.1 uncharacterized protein LOC112296156 isoform X15 [Physcomitrella patens]